MFKQIDCHKDAKAQSFAKFVNSFPNLPLEHFEPTKPTELFCFTQSSQRCKVINHPTPFNLLNLLNL